MSLITIHLSINLWEPHRQLNIFIQSISLFGGEKLFINKVRFENNIIIIVCIKESAQVQLWKSTGTGLLSCW